MSLILVLIILVIPTAAENSTNATNDIGYFLIAGDQIILADRELNITADDTLKFRILDNYSKNKIFTTTGVIKLESETKIIDWHSITELLKNELDKIIGSVSNFFGGQSMVGNNSNYYAEYTFNERPTAENYTMKVRGEFNSNLTNNTITINVRSKYSTLAVGNIGKTYELQSMKNLNTRKLKFHTDNTQNINDLIKNIGDFLEASNELKNKVNNLTNNPKDLPFDNVITSQDKLEKSIKEYEAKIENEKLIKKQLSDQLNLIRDGKDNINNDLINITYNKTQNLLKQDLDNASAMAETTRSKFSTAKSDFREDVFIPAGALVVLGLIIGYFNVNRWKKESEYFGLYTSKANITSPITIAIILTVVISILIGIIISIEGDLNMFKFLI